MKKLLSGISFVLGLSAPVVLWADQAIAETAITQFRQVDVDGNGYLSEKEVKTETSATRGLSVSRYGGFELADVNEDGRLSTAEFAAFEEELPAE